MRRDPSEATSPHGPGESRVPPSLRPGNDPGGKPRHAFN